ncbi:hypothetical protein BsWGS_14101 [Bradybaena similaris]
MDCKKKSIQIRRPGTRVTTPPPSHSFSYAPADLTAFIVGCLLLLFRNLSVIKLLFVGFTGLCPFSPTQYLVQTLTRCNQRLTGSKNIGCQRLIIKLNLLYQRHPVSMEAVADWPG